MGVRHGPGEGDGELDASSRRMVLVEIVCFCRARDSGVPVGLRISCGSVSVREAWPFLV